MTRQPWSYSLRSRRLFEKENRDTAAPPVRTFTRILGYLGLLFLTLTLAPAPPGQAEDGRDFFAMYASSNASVGTDTAAVTLTLRLFNHSRIDVTEGSVVLEDSSQSNGIFGSISGVTVPYRDHVRLRADFFISRAEYDSWQQGGQPKMRIEFTDANGNSVSRNIEMTPGPVLEQEAE